VKKLASNPVGRIILRTCRVEQFKSSAVDWKEREAQNLAKRAMFADILEDPKSKNTKDNQKISKRKIEEIIIESEGKTNLQELDESIQNLKETQYIKKKQKKVEGLTRRESKKNITR